MAAADVATPFAPTVSETIVEPFKDTATKPRHDVQTVMNYYLEPEDGSPPAPTYIEYVFRFQYA